MRDQPGLPTENSPDPLDVRGVDDRGVSRRTALRRGAIAGGALLWVTPVVQSMGGASAYAWNHGSRPPNKPPGKCACSEVVSGVKAVDCRPDMAGTAVAESGKTVVLEMLQTSSCGTCGTQSETHEIRQINGRGAQLLPRADTGSTRFEVHVTAHPASIKVRIKSVLVCVAEHGRTHRCEDDKVVTVCFSSVYGSASNRCGTVRVNKQETHLGTQACG